MSQVTPDDIKAGLRILRVLADAIKELGQVPSGVLYARISDLMSLDNYNGAIRLLEQAKMIEVKNHVIHWKGGI